MTGVVQGGGRSHHLGSNTRCSGLSSGPRRARINADVCFPLTSGETEPKDGATCVWVNDKGGTRPGLDHHELMCDLKHGQLHAHACTLNTLGAMAGVAPYILLAQWHEIALGIREVTGHLGEFITAIEIAIREAMHDLVMLDHDTSRHSFTVFRLRALKGRVLPVIEVVDGGNGGKITGVFGEQYHVEID